ncbi:glycosyltransferase family 58 protein [Malassezia pachydermatis]|uniref:Dol-P-Man:Man(5)GlcNAc(2)-PP-Dol alpha-1,3-mannosyltransferase n=1 Tax=Malassezia pachydermatis TaxID=77020 RepID=A0A0M8MQY7_9BASI|nr:glycosyltransferase family 58 protein [Malassezia pachydermatis]KOS15047.1 glycosyltransferase family 58 protein [Malassezia pachydermatis]
MLACLPRRDTEIDFSTYVNQARLFLAGERDYRAIDPIGGSGPCVYPAGHLYIYALLDKVSAHAAHLLPAQVVFGAVYLVTLVVISHLYRMAGAPPILIPMLALSKRLHSIFVLRLFNDPIAMLFMYIATWFLCRRRWSMACVVYSLALSIKMNVLLFLPGLLVILFRAWGAVRTIGSLAGLIVLPQLLLGGPFLASYPASYLSQAFDFSRVFLYEWTVNWRFLDEKVFVSPKFSRTLLGAHALCLLAFGLFRWTQLGTQGVSWIKVRWHGDRTPMSAQYILLTLWTSNLIGMICARSLHYQFYSWYAHQLPLLVWSSRLPAALSVVLLVLIEAAWNTFPSTPASSLGLLLAHLLLLMGIWTRRQHAPMHVE